MPVRAGDLWPGCYNGAFGVGEQLVSLEQAKHVLQHVYGYDHFRGQQEAAIEAVLAGQDCLVLMPTGGGKSLCYQVPAQVLEGTALVVSPLIALMQDQVTALQELGVRAEYLNSTLSPEEQQRITQEFAQGELELLYVAPERLLQPRTLDYLSRARISLIAIDEAHCVSQWGHDFRKDYLGLTALKDHFPEVPLMALTATADERTRLEIEQQLRLHQPVRLTSSFDRPNIRYHVSVREDGRKQLIRFLAQHRDESGIVYCLSRKKVEATAEWLQTRNVNALPYHAGLSPELRQHNQQRFLREDGIVMVATIAFGMGIDKPDVRFVFHMDLPKSIESYYQETGRAGRDGADSEVHMVYGLQDVVRLTQMLDQSPMEENQKRVERHKLNALLGWCEVTGCRRQALLSYFQEDYPEPCGDCDNCLNPPDTRDATEQAQKLLSAIYRTGQRFGAAHVIDTLRGADTEKVRQFGHQALSTYGIGREFDANQWQALIRQLMIQGYVNADVERYGALVLTDRSRALLKGEELFTFRDVTPLQKTERSSKKRGISVSEGDRQLWDALRACRMELAKSRNVPPYVIFHDATLMQMMELKPQSLRAMGFIEGIGDSKLEQYGERFLDVIQSFV